MSVVGSPLALCNCSHRLYIKRVDVELCGVVPEKYVDIISYCHDILAYIPFRIRSGNM